MPAHIIERAYQLAADCSDMDDLRRKLSKEGYANVDGHLYGRSLRTDLRKRFNPGTRGGLVLDEPHTSD